MATILIAAVGLFAVSQQKLGNLQTDPLLFLWYILGGAVFAVCGMGAYVELKLLDFFRGLAAFNIEVFLNEEPYASTRAIATLSFKVTLWWSWLAILVETATFMTPFFRDPLILALIPFGALPSALLVVGHFGIHRVMLNNKRHRLIGFARQLRPVYDEAIEKPTLENISRFKELIEVQRQFENMPEWAFNSTNLTRPRTYTCSIVKWSSLPRYSFCRNQLR